MIQRGEIYYVEKLDTENMGSEQRPNRPAIVVSNDLCNKYSPVIEVVYLTTQPKKEMPTHVPINSAKYPGTALCEQIHSVAVERLGGCVGHCTHDEMERIDKALCASLGLSMGGDTPKPVSTTPAAGEQNTASSDLNSELIATKAQLSMMQQLYNSLLAQTVRSA